MSEDTRPWLIRLAQLRTEIAYAALDVALVAMGMSIVLLFRFDGSVPISFWQGYLRFIPFAAALFVALQWATGLYGQVWRYAGLNEAVRLVATGVLISAVLGLAVMVGPRTVPISVALLGSIVTTLLIGLARFQSRLVSFQRERDPRRAASRGVVIIGAGRHAAALARQLQEPGTGYRPVAILDADPRNRGRTIAGVRVHGTPRSLGSLSLRCEVHEVILAVPGATKHFIRDIASLADEIGATLRVIPSSEHLLANGLRLADIRDVEIDDLLGREPVPVDLDAVRALLHGRRVLITGAGGSIGSEIARQVARCEPAQLTLVDHDETHLFDVQATLKGFGTCVLADIRDHARIDRVFASARPEIVFHAAAHKHVPMLEANPSEAIRTNVLGTRNLVTSAKAVGVSRFVLISTDKAVHPSSVMGATKRISEHIVLSGGDGYSAVRFGNVLGSRGSVVPTFVRQIQAGGPVTVTDARMTRFFMTIPEAVQLVLAAASMSRGREIFMLDMGSPVLISALAERMIKLAGLRPGTDIEISYTGIRPGEKLHEELYLPEESPQPTAHPSIHRLMSAIWPPHQVEAQVRWLSSMADTDSGTAMAIRQVAVEPAAPRLTLDQTLIEPDSVRATAPIVLADVRSGDAWSQPTI